MSIYLSVGTYQPLHHKIKLFNLGFYEAKQIQHLLDMVRNWCVRMGCVYGGGLAVGAGPLLVRIWNLPVNKDVKAGISKMAKAISKKEAMGNYYTKTIVPRAVYLQAARKKSQIFLQRHSAKHMKLSIL